MAEEEINIDLVINNANAANSVKELKTSLNELKNAAAGLDENSEAFTRVAAAAGETKNKIDDLNSSIKAQSGAPIENVAGSFGLLSDKLKNLDFKGANSALGGFSKSIGSISFSSLTSGLKGFGSQLLSLGKTLLANPIFLLAAVIIAVSKAAYDLGKSFNEVNKQTITVTESIKSQKDELEKYADDIQNVQIKIQESLGVYTKSLAEQKVAEVRHNREILDLKKTHNENIKKLAEELSVDIADIENGRLSEKYKGDITDLNNRKHFNQEILKLEEDLYTQQRILKAKQELENQEIRIRNSQENIKKSQESIKKSQETTKQIADDLEKERQKTIDAIKFDAVAERDKVIEINDQIIEATKKGEEELSKEVDRLRKKDKEEEEKRWEWKSKKRKEESEKEIQDAKDLEAEKFATINEVTNSLQGLSDTLFAIKLSNTKKGSAEEEKAARNQFKVNKALGIAATTISTVQAVMNALATGIAPFNIIRSVAIGIAGAANIAKIAATQFQGGGGVAPVSPPTETSTPTETAAPRQQFVSPELQKITTEAKDKKTEIQQPIRAYVMESEISGVQNKNNLIERRATF